MVVKGKADVIEKVRLAGPFYRRQLICYSRFWALAQHICVIMHYVDNRGSQTLCFFLIQHELCFFIPGRIAHCAAMLSPPVRSQFFLTALILFTLYVMFSCKRCPDNFTTDSARGLSLHQNKCPIYAHQTEDIFNARKTLGSQRLKQRSTLKARKLRLLESNASTATNTVRYLYQHMFNCIR